MSRTTAFPTVEVESIRIKQGDSGITKEERLGGFIQDFTPEMVEDLMESFEEMVGPLSDDFEIEYTLLIKGFSRRGVKTKARMFARVKNPFEPEFTSIDSVNKTGMRKLFGSSPVPDFTIYRVKVSVTK